MEWSQPRTFSLGRSFDSIVPRIDHAGPFHAMATDRLTSDESIPLSSSATWEKIPNALLCVSSVTEL
eukprot:scaffold2073_cov107-Cylindrotheca_fusiformis.AAC.1